MAGRGDLELVEGLRRGDPAAFDRAYEKYRAKVYGFLVRACRRTDLADDLFQETWLSLARSAPSLREDTDLGAWLFSVARNAWRSHRRWQLLDVSRWLVIGATEEAIDERSPEDATAEARETARLERALGELPDAYREVLLLVGVEGMDQTRVAEVLGIGYPALRKRLSRAREMLASRLGMDAKSRLELAEKGGTP